MPNVKIETGLGRLAGTRRQHHAPATHWQDRTCANTLPIPGGWKSRPQPT